MQTIVTPHVSDAINIMSYELQCLSRWSEVTNGHHKELAKQALNCMITYIWATEISHHGIKVDFTKFPKIALFRSFTKTGLCDMIEENLDTILKLNKTSKTTFIEKITSNTGKESIDFFIRYLQVDPNCLEVQIYQAATKIATWIELHEIRNLIDKKDFRTKRKQLQKALHNFSVLPCYRKIMHPRYKELFRNFSKLRNRIRWAKHPTNVKSSVLGHMFDVACYAYLMSLEENPNNQELATQYFFMGVFHDLPECWTGDMPSPIKDSIPGLRKATEDFENQVMEKHVYSQLPKYMEKAIRSVMLEDKENIEYKVLLKKADNLSAYVECWREIDAGSHHYYYRNVIKGDYNKKNNLTPSFCNLMEELYYDCL